MNKGIKIRCSLPCYWNLGKYTSNCANLTITLTDSGCDKFLTPEEAKDRISKALKRDAKRNWFIRLFKRVKFLCLNHQ